MKRGQDIAIQFPGLYLVHHNLPGKEVEEHTHEKEHILFIPLQGEIEIELSNQTIKAGPGKMIYLPAGTRHAFHSTKNQGERLIALVEAQKWKSAGGTMQTVGLVAALQRASFLSFTAPENKECALFDFDVYSDPV